MTATILTASPHRHHHVLQQHNHHMHGTMFRIQPDLTQGMQSSDYQMHHPSSNSPALTALSSVESNELIPLTTIVHSGAPNRYFLRSSSSTTSGSHSHLEQDPG